mmetsp:Transcript_15413/g.41375  ORF Transcript_15413/g.41375 Transcript_15413/m.41375 type:complete len:290 (-) Transcript_15413:536-1405(-)
MPALCAPRHVISSTCKDHLHEFTHTFVHNVSHSSMKRTRSANATPSLQQRCARYDEASGSEEHPHEPDAAADSDAQLVDCVRTAEQHHMRAGGSRNKCTADSTQHDARYDKVTKSTQILKDFSVLGAYMYSCDSVHACRSCEYSTVNRANLLFHVLGVHLRISCFRCRLCELRTTNYTNIAQHSRRRHPEERPSAQRNFHCSECATSSTAPLGIVYHYFERHFDATQAQRPVETAEGCASEPHRASAKSDLLPRSALDDNAPRSDEQRHSAAREQMSVDRLLLKQPSPR